MAPCTVSFRYYLECFACYSHDVDVAFVEAYGDDSLRRFEHLVSVYGVEFEVAVIVSVDHKVVAVISHRNFICRVVVDADEVEFERIGVVVVHVFGYVVTFHYDSHYAFGCIGVYADGCSASV